jgi:hypothetical protein
MANLAVALVAANALTLARAPVLPPTLKTESDVKAPVLADPACLEVGDQAPAVVGAVDLADMAEARITRHPLHPTANCTSSPETVIVLW